jgi:hypothetical protein
VGDAKMALDPLFRVNEVLLHMGFLSNLSWMRVFVSKKRQSTNVSEFRDNAECWCDVVCGALVKVREWRVRV